MVLSFIWGQKAYRIPYAWRKLCVYIVIVVLLYFIHGVIAYFFTGNIVSIITALVLLLSYIWFILNVERKEFQKLPVIGKYIKGN
jgi:uncharacterized membrane protein